MVIFETILIFCSGMSWSAGKDFISRPYFGEQETDIVVQQGEVAFFNCHVHNLANQTVSIIL